MIHKPFILIFCILYMVVQDSPGQKNPAGGLEKMAGISMNSNSLSGAGYLEDPQDGCPSELDNQPGTLQKLYRTSKPIRNVREAWPIHIKEMGLLFLDLPPPQYHC